MKNSFNFHKLLIPLSTGCLIIAILLTTARVLSPNLNRYQPLIEKWASQQLSQPVQIKQIKASWDMFSPVIQLDNVEIYNNEHTRSLLHIERLGLRISIFQSMLQQRVTIDKLLVTGSSVSIKQIEQGNYSISDIKSLASQSPTTDLWQTLNEMSTWIFAQPEVYLDNISLQISYAKGKSFLLTGLTIHLHNHGNTHHITGQGALSQKHPSSIFFDTYLHGSLQNLQTFTADIYLHANDIVVAQLLNEWTAQFFQLHAGVLNTDIWATWKNKNWDKIKAQFNVKHLHLTTPKQQQYNLDQLEGSLEFLHLTDTQWSVKGDKIRFYLNKSHYSDNQFYVLLTQQAKQQLKIENVQIALFDMKLLALFRDYLPMAWQQWLTQLQPSGKLKQLNLNYHEATHACSLNAILEKLTLKAWKKYPGIKNLSGVLAVNNQQGTLQVNSPGLELNFGKEFQQPIKLTNLKGDIAWQQSDNDWLVKLKKLSAYNQDVAIQGDMLLKIPAADTGIQINTLFKYQILNIKNKTLYLPLTLLSKNLVTWLDQAIIDGKTASGSLSIRGNLNDFPFSNHQGNFVVDTQLKGMQLAYQPNWPMISNLNARLRFLADQMLITADQGNIFTSNITAASAVIPRLNADIPILNISGNINSSLMDGLKFLSQSPLQRVLGDNFQDLSLTGPMKLNLQLTIPLATEDSIKVKGDAEFADAQLALPKWNIASPLSAGKISFTENSVQSSVIHASLFNKPVQFFLAKQANASATTLQVNGSIDINTLLTMAPFNQYVTGQTQYQATVVFNSDLDHHDHLVVTSDLRGIASTFPKPLAKTSSEIRLLSADMQLGNDKKLPVSFNYDQHIFGNLLLQNLTHSWALERGTVSFGEKETTLPTTTGLNIRGKLATFSADKWKAFADSIAASKDKLNLNTLAIINNINVEIGKLFIFKKILTSADIKLQSNSNSWDLTIDSQMISGNIQIPKNEHAFYNINLEHLHLTDTAQQQLDIPTLSNIPALNFKCTDLQYNNKKLHAVTFNLTPITIHWLKITNLTITSPSLALKAAGYWQQKDKRNMTKLKGEATSKDLKATLSDFSLPASITSKKSMARFKLKWPSIPYDPSLSLLNGRIFLSLKNGKIADIGENNASKIGFGRLLTLLSLQSLQRRLTLDFSDLSTTGYGFDKLEGDFKLQNGNAYSSNLSVESAVALINLQGRIGIAAKDLNLDITVIPHLTASLPIIATIAGGPIAGIAAIAADKILSKEVQKYAKYHYTMRGSWEKPTIQPKPK